jgi:hypothetical protein
MTEISISDMSIYIAMDISEIRYEHIGNPIWTYWKSDIARSKIHNFQISDMSILSYGYIGNGHIGNPI